MIASLNCAVLFIGMLLPTISTANTLKFEEFEFKLLPHWSLKKEIKNSDKIALGLDIDGEHLQINIEYVDEKDERDIIPQAIWLDDDDSRPFKTFVTRGHVDGRKTYGFYAERGGIRYLGFTNIPAERAELAQQIYRSLKLREK